VPVPRGGGGPGSRQYSGTRPPVANTPPVERAYENRFRRRVHVPFWDGEQWSCRRPGCIWYAREADKEAGEHYGLEMDETMRACEKRAESEAGA
jgi:hypothetical protein